MFFFLMAAAIVVLRRRHVDWPRAFVENKWIWLYFAFGLVSVLWSAEPMMSFRRVPKGSGECADGDGCPCGTETILRAG